MKKREGVKRVLITSIGGGNTEDKNGNMVLKNYYDTVYSINDKTFETTTYMPKVIEDAFEVDKTIIIGTTGTMWDNVYLQYCIKHEKEVNQNYIDDLRETERTSDRDTDIKNLNISKLNQEFGNNVKGIVIKYGLNREEIFENFDSIIELQEEFNDEDEYEVILDITHSFRSMAFWMFLVMTYLTDVSNKKIKIIEVTYGMFEAKKEKTDPSPIILLNSFLEILNWIKGASELKQYGNSYYILENLKNNNDIPEEIKDELENFSNAMNMNYISSLLESIKKLKELDENNKIDEILGPAKHIIPDILKKFIKDFDIKESNDNRRSYLLQATLAKWHFNQKRYAMAAININEALANFIGNSLNLKPQNSVKFDPNSEAKNWLNDLYKLFKNKETLSEIEKKYQIYGEVYFHTRRIRNEIAHSLGNEVDIIDDIAKLKNYSTVILELLKDENFIKQIEEKFKLLEKKNKKSKEETEINDKREKNILLLSTKTLTNEEKDELKLKWNIKNIISLTESELNLWRNITSENDIQFFKNLIDEKLIKGDYILIHGNLKNMAKIKGYTITKELLALCLLDSYSKNTNFFEKYL